MDTKYPVCWIACLTLFLNLGLAFSAPTYAAQAAVTPLENAGGPLRVRNLSPVMQLYGTPRMVGARVIDGDMEASFNFEAANNFQSELSNGTFGFFDGETYVSSWRVRNNFPDDWAPGWEWGVEIPWVIHTPGALDSLVEEFHSLFGLPDGDRNLTTRNRLDYFVGADGVVYADFNASRRELGDVRAFLGRQIFDRENSALALRAQLKFPTGDVEDLSGSGGTDVAIWGEYEWATPARLPSGPVRLTLSAGMVYLSEGDLIPNAQEHWVPIGHLGIQIPLGPRVEFHAQMDAHGRILNTGNPLVADAGVLGTLGGRIAVTDRFWIDLAIIEDLENEAASDVVFQVLLGTRL